MVALTRSGSTIAHTPQRSLTEDSLLSQVRWRTGRIRIPLISRTRVDTVPYDGLSVSLSGDGNHLIYEDHLGWHLLDPDPEAWKRRLCALYLDARLTTPPARKASGDPPCR